MKENNRAVYFVSAIRPLDTNVTSTDIMTSSLLQGIKRNGKKIVFFAICEHTDEMNRVKKCYSQYADIVIPLPSAFGYGLSKYKMLQKLLFRSFFTRFYSDVIKKKLNKIYEPELILSHSPSFESVCYSNAIRRIYRKVSYYQYWSDPIALSGITPDKFNIKRCPFWFIEKRAMSSADKIIFGTRTLMDFQKQMYPKLASKMSYIDIPYVEKENAQQKVVPHTILYAGNYHKKIRNIEPLVEAVESLDGYKLDIFGDGELIKKQLKNTSVHERISADELKKIECRYEYLACVLNHSCIQIPGKIFYDMARNVKIIVIADGNHKEDICNYLSEYKRFIVCENNPEDIAEKIRQSNEIKTLSSYVIENFSPQRILLDLLNGGKH